MRDAVVALLLLQPRHLHGVTRRVGVLPHRDVQLEAVLILAAAVDLLVDVVEHQHARCVVARAFDRLDGLVDGLVLANLEVQLHCLGIFFARCPHVARLVVLASPLIVLGNALVVDRPCLTLHDARKRVHLRVALRDVERLVHLARQQQKFNSARKVLRLQAPPREQRRRLHRPCPTHDRVRLGWRVEPVDGEAHHAVHVAGRLVRDRGLGVATLRLLGLSKLKVQLGRRHLGHERRSGGKVLALDVDAGSALVLPRALVHLSCLGQLLQRLEDLRRLLVQLWAVDVDDL
mmetsp:Transcript_38193/g.113180  ORF Transcript_38193/g.113180 Transcript_38193/m.113180 type:complete len:290 (-) Transcript_38193:2987-3856(-)